nr:hypothetical protein [Acidocella facilis]
MRVAHPALGGQRIGMALQRPRRATQNRHLQALIMAEMHMGGGDAEIMLMVLRLHQAQRQVALGVVVNIGQGGDAGCGAIAQMVLARRLAQHLPHRLRAAGIAAQRRQRVQLGEKLVIDGDGDPFHVRSVRRMRERGNLRQKAYDRILFSSYA